MRFSAANDCQSIPELLRWRSGLHPDRIAAMYVDDDGIETSLTYAALWNQTVAVAKAMQSMLPNGKASQPTDAPRALLIHPPGLDFLPSFIGAQLAGWIPVPTCYPKPNRTMPRVDSVARNCVPTLILSTSQTIANIDRRRLDPAAASLPMLAVDSLDVVTGDTLFDQTSYGISADSIALLQYTSGSTSEPKGVIVSQRNVLANVAAIATGFGVMANDTDSNETLTCVSWLPFFHDMGLIGGLLMPLSIGWRSVFMNPQSFVQRPIRWLKMISDYRATVSGAPNFAFELCADRIAPTQMESLDLSSWQVASCGAEPIRARTLHTFAQRFSSAGFRESAFYPCYGLAEATLMAAGGAGPSVPQVIEVDRSSLRSFKVDISTTGAKRDTLSLVGCGASSVGTTLKIVDPETLVELPERMIGEVWLDGTSVTRGYWNRAEESASRFGVLKISVKQQHGSRWFGRAKASLEVVPETTGKPYLRTGDLGFVHHGQLYITGRIKDIVIVRGRNYAPQDIETSVANLGLPLQGRSIAISVDGPRAEGLAVIAEIARDTSQTSYAGIVRDIRRAIIEEHEIDPRLVVLVRIGTVPLTTSGKVQRSACRTAMLEGKLEARFRWERSGGAESPPLPIPELPAVAMPSDRIEIESLVRDWLAAWLISRVGIDPVEIDVNRNFDDYGLDSLTAVELSGELEDWSGVELTPTNAWEHPTIASMADLVATGLIGSGSERESQMSAASSAELNSCSGAAK